MSDWLIDAAKTWLKVAAFELIGALCLIGVVAVVFAIGLSREWMNRR